MKDPYSILGVEKNATDDEIKEAYRALARKYHPDNYGDDNPLKDLAKDKMQEINAAYDDIMRSREKAKNNDSNEHKSYTGGGSTGFYADVRRLVEARRFRDAEQYNSQELFYMTEHRADRCIVRSPGKFGLYLKPRKGGDYIQKKLEGFDRNPQALFCCFNSLDQASAQDQKQVIDWISRRISL